MINVTNSVQTHKASYTYDAFRNVRNETVRNTFGATVPAVDQLFRFTGRFMDEDTALQNNLHRWYDPKIGRWLSEDPIGFAGGDANLYRYLGYGVWGMGYGVWGYGGA